MDKKPMFKEITISIPEPLLAELIQFMYFRKMTGNGLGPDYSFCLQICAAMAQKRRIVLIDKDENW